MDLNKGGDSNDWFFLAMASWQMGYREEARRWYQQAADWMEKHASQDAELLRFRARQRICWTCRRGRCFQREVRVAVQHIRGTGDVPRRLCEAGVTQRLSHKGNTRQTN